MELGRGRASGMGIPTLVLDCWIWPTLPLVQSLWVFLPDATSFKLPYPVPKTTTEFHLGLLCLEVPLPLSKRCLTPSRTCSALLRYLN